MTGEIKITDQIFRRAIKKAERAAPLFLFRHGGSPTVTKADRRKWDGKL